MSNFTFGVNVFKSRLLLLCQKCVCRWEMVKDNLDSITTDGFCRDTIYQQCQVFTQEITQYNYDTGEGCIKHPSQSCHIKMLTNNISGADDFEHQSKNIEHL